MDKSTLVILLLAISIMVIGFPFAYPEYQKILPAPPQPTPEPTPTPKVFSPNPLLFKTHWCRTVNTVKHCYRFSEDHTYYYGRSDMFAESKMDDTWIQVSENKYAISDQTFSIYDGSLVSTLNYDAGPFTQDAAGLVRTRG